MKKFLKKKFLLWMAVAVIIFLVLPCLLGIFLGSAQGTNTFLLLVMPYVDTAAFIVLGLVSGIWIKDMFPLPFISYVMYVVGVCLYWVVYDLFAFMYVFGVMLIMMLYYFTIHFGIMVISLAVGVVIGFLARKIKARRVSRKVNGDSSLVDGQ